MKKILFVLLSAFISTHAFAVTCLPVKKSIGEVLEVDYTNEGWKLEFDITKKIVSDIGTSESTDYTYTTAVEGPSDGGTIEGSVDGNSFYWGKNKEFKMIRGGFPTGAIRVGHGGLGGIFAAKKYLFNMYTYAPDGKIFQTRTLACDKSIYRAF